MIPIVFIPVSSEPAVSFAVAEEVQPQVMTTAAIATAIARMKNPDVFSIYLIEEWWFI
jgi:hypothetical protein